MELFAFGLIVGWAILACLYPILKDVDSKRFNKSEDMFRDEDNT